MPILLPLLLGSSVVLASRWWNARRERAEGEVSISAAPRQDASVVESAQADQNLALAVTALGFSGVGGLFAPVVVLAALPIMLSLAVPLLRERIRMIREGKRPSVALLDIVAFGGTLVTGHIFAAALGETFILVGEKLLRKTKRKSEDRLGSLFATLPRTAWVLRDGVEIEVPLEEVGKGAVISVTAGSIIPVDGVLQAGAGRVDERAITGESQPADKGKADRVFATTLLLEGRLEVLCEQTGGENLTNRIGDILRNTSHFTDTISSRGEDIVERGALPTLLLTAVTLPLLGTSSALAVSYCSFGYAMRLAAPISALNFLYIAAQRGILIKDARALEELAFVDTVVFDKTGTLTEEVPSLGAIQVVAHLDEAQVLALAAAMERRQSHPIAVAITTAAAARSLHAPSPENVGLSVGFGLSGWIDGHRVLIGSRRMMEGEGLSQHPQLEAAAARTSREGGTLVYLAVDDVLVGALEIRPTIRAEARQLIQELHGRGLKVAILSGDREEPARTIARELNIDLCFAEVLPEQKSDIITRLQAEGRRVCFVGDGVNDAIALKSANVSVSLAGATHVATDTASVVLLDGTLNKLCELIDLGIEMRRNLLTATALTVIPGIACVTMVYTIGLGVAGALVLYNIALAASVGVATLPLLRHLRPKAAGEERLGIANPRQLLASADENRQAPESHA